MDSYGFENPLRRSDVIGFEFVREQAADLCLIDYHRVSAREAVGPWAGFGEIRLDDLNARMYLAEQAHIGLVLIDADEFQIVSQLQSRHKILPDKAGCPSNNDLSHQSTRNSSC